MKNTYEITETLRKINAYAKSTDSELVRKIIKEDVDKLRSKLYTAILRERVRKAQTANRLFTKK